jgi:outer membrane protein TolC
VRLRFWELLTLQRLIELHRSIVANAEEATRTTREMFNTGQANRADVLLAEVRLNDTKIALLTVHNQYPALWQHLAALVGSPHLPPGPLTGQLDQGRAGAGLGQQSEPAACREPGAASGQGPRGPRPDHRPARAGTAHPKHPAPRGCRLQL